MPVQVAVRAGHFKGCTLITGFHGIGETGYIAVSYLVHALDAKRIGFVDVSYPPPFVATSERGIVTPFEVYRSGKLVLVKLEFSPHRMEEAEFAKKLAKWVMHRRFKDAVLIGGLDSNFRSGEENIRIVPTRSYVRRAKAFEAPALEPGLYVYGPLAVMLGEFEMRGFPAIAVLPYASASHADPGAAAVAIRGICTAMRLIVDVSQLEKDAKEIERDVENRLTQAKKSLQGMYV